MILVFDSSISGFSAAIVDDEKIIQRVSNSDAFSYSEFLVSSIKRLLDTVGRESISSIVVTRGPGSFSGVRAGIAAAIGFQVGLQVPVYSISTMEALARSTDEEGPFSCILDNKCGFFYFQEFLRQDNHVKALSEISLVKELPEGLLVTHVSNTILNAKNVELDLLAISKVRSDQSMAPEYVSTPEFKEL